MTEDGNGKTYSFDTCSECKLICCQDANPPLTINRKKILSDCLKVKKIPIQSLFVEEDYSHPAADANGICAFYNKKTKKCRVHQVKPETCLAGPVTFDINLKTRKLEFFLKKAELCVLAQELYEDKKRFNAHLEVARAAILRLICELDAEALKAILRIPEPQTFKIGENELPTEVLFKLGIE
jgi:uncharacterized protein